MTRTQRLAWLAVAVAIAVVALIVLSGPGGDEEPERAAAPAPTGTPEATGTPVPEEAEPLSTPTPEPTPDRPREPVLRAGRITTVTAESGETVRFSVRSSRDEEIHVHGYDIERAVPAGETVKVRFPASIEGIFEVELHGSGEQIGRLRVEP